MYHQPTSIRSLADSCDLLASIQEEGDGVVLRRAANALRDFAEMIKKLESLRQEISKTTSLVAPSLVANSIIDALSGEN